MTCAGRHPCLCCRVVACMAAIRDMPAGIQHLQPVSQSAPFSHRMVSVILNAESSWPWNLLAFHAIFYCIWLWHSISGTACFHPNLRMATVPMLQPDLSPTWVVYHVQVPGSEARVGRPCVQQHRLCRYPQCRLCLATSPPRSF